jgi:hypothetical protein
MINMDECCYRERGAALVSTIGAKSEFVELDITNRRMLERALEGNNVSHLFALSELWSNDLYINCNIY